MRDLIVKIEEQSRGLDQVSRERWILTNDKRWDKVAHLEISKSLGWRWRCKSHAFKWAIHTSDTVSSGLRTRQWRRGKNLRNDHQTKIIIIKRPSDQRPQGTINITTFQTSLHVLFTSLKIWLFLLSQIKARTLKKLACHKTYSFSRKGEDRSTSSTMSWHSLFQVKHKPNELILRFQSDWANWQPHELISCNLSSHI